MRSNAFCLLVRTARGREKRRACQAVSWNSTTPLATKANSLPTIKSQHAFSTSVSETEVQKFNALHSEWWDPKKNPLIQMNTIRVQYIREQVEAQLSTTSTATNSITNDTTDKAHNPHTSSSSSLPFQGLSMLDIGCGGGVLTESLKRLGAAQAVGIDPSSHLLHVAKQRAVALGGISDDSNNNNNVPEYHCTTAEEWAAQNPQTYDVVCIMDVIEHIPQIDSVGQAIARLLKPNGILIVSTLNRTALSYALTIVGAEYIMGYVPAGTHDWNLYRSPQEVQALWKPWGLEQTHVSGMVLRRPPVLQWDWKLDPTDLNINWVAAYRLQSASTMADDDDDGQE